MSVHARHDSVVLSCSPLRFTVVNCAFPRTSDQGSSGRPARSPGHFPISPPRRPSGQLRAPGLTDSAMRAPRARARSVTEESRRTWRSAATKSSCRTVTPVPTSSWWLACHTWSTRQGRMADGSPPDKACAFVPCAPEWTTDPQCSKRGARGTNGHIPCWLLVLERSDRAWFSWRLGRRRARPGRRGRRRPWRTAPEWADAALVPSVTATGGAHPRRVSPDVGSGRHGLRRSSRARTLG
jgi:hypothetical protein